MDEIATVGELSEWLATQPSDAEIRLAGVRDRGLAGWVTGERDGKPVVVLAFYGLIPKSQAVSRTR